MGTGKVAALILAAGYSSRMGDFKPLLSLQGKPVITRTIAGLRQGGITDIRVVVGYRAADLLPVLSSQGVAPIINKDYHAGMFSSILTGLNSLAGERDGFFLLPGDIPLVKSTTVEKLLEKYHQTGCSVVYPTFLGERGHPPFIARKCFAEILAADVEANLSLILEKFAQDACEVECVDQGVLLDMDTPEDYRQILEMLKNRHIPTQQECRALFSLVKAPERVIRHGRAVAEAGEILARVLNEQGGFTLDLELIRAAGLLHDLAKGSSEHARRGADILAREGFPCVAQIIFQHMDLELTGEDPLLDETAIVYLADKLIKDDTLVGIEARFAQVRSKNKDEPQILEKIEKRLNTALVLKKQAELYLAGADLSRFLLEKSSLLKSAD
ncbi:MAG: DVU_1551 family NTP transferase [Peptococcaceae bacterium]